MELASAEHELERQAAFLSSDCYKEQVAELQKEVERLNAVRQELMDNLDHWRNAHRCMSNELFDLMDERDSLRARVAVLETGLQRIRDYSIHSEPVGGALEMQDIARAALKGEG